MKIIDSNKDYYDFYQNIYRDSTFTFDRRDSYNLSREEFMKHFRYEARPYRWYKEKKEDRERVVVLQIGYTYFYFILTILTTDNFGTCTSYDLRLDKIQKNYNAEAVPVRILYQHYHRYYLDSLDVMGPFTIVLSGKAEERHIPLLKDIGIPALVPPLDIYLALEEYFSMQKQAQEKTESVGLTNNEKITNHGFDLKDSFRGK